MRIRRVQLDDVMAVAAMRQSLWPDGSIEEHADEVREIVAGAFPSTLPFTTLVAVEDTAILGFADVGLRSHADGCDLARPVGYLEGWYVTQGVRRQGVGRQLLAAAEAWAIAQGCVEMASDTWIDNPTSIAAHAALGFEEVDRCVTYRKDLGKRLSPSPDKNANHAPSKNLNSQS